MRIIMLIDSLRSGGKERRLLQLIKGLISKPFIEVELVIMSSIIHFKEVHDIEVKIHTLERKSKKDVGLIFKMIKLMRKIKPDLIHTWGSMESMYGVLIGKYLQIPLINGMITNAPPNLSKWDKNAIRARFTFPFSDLIIANSHAGLKVYAAPSNKSYCVHNGFDFDRMHVKESIDTIKEKLKISRPFVIGMIGAFKKRKDYETYLKAAFQVLSSRKDVTFLAIGGGDDLMHYQELVNQEGHEENILFTGIISNVESYINMLDIGVLSTNLKVHGEGISNAIMEYMAFAKPVIATEGGGTPEIVAHNKSGYIVKYMDYKDMAVKINFLLENPDVAIKMGLEGKQIIKNEFSLEKMTKDYIFLYEKLLDKHIN